MSVDVSQLPPDIRAYIEAEVSKAIHANEPAPPRELTPAEKTQAAVKQAYAALAGEQPVSRGSQYIHACILAAVEALAGEVFKSSASSGDSSVGEA